MYELRTTNPLREWWRRFTQRGLRKKYLKKLRARNKHLVEKDLIAMLDAMEANVEEGKEINIADLIQMMNKS